MMKTKLLALVLSLAMATALTACSQKADVSGSDLSSQDSESGEMAGEWNPVVTQRQVLADEGSMCGVVNLIYDTFGTYSAYDHDIQERDYYVDLLNHSKYAEDFEFLPNIPYEYWAAAPGGQDLYLIIPADENAKVQINYVVWDDDAGEMKTGDPLYSQDNGAPFLLKCNHSDIFPECEVLITDSNGEELNWQPMISMRDGSIFNTDQNGKKIHDFTEYPEGIPETD